MTGEVFISYARADRAYVDRLASFLKDVGGAVWYDYEIASGDRFATVIQEQIRGCAAMVVVLTPEAVASVWVNREISYADKLQKPILPLMLEESELPFLIHDLHYEDVTAGGLPSEAFVARLRRQTAPPAADRQVPSPIPTISDVPPASHAKRPIPGDDLTPAEPPREVVKKGGTVPGARVGTPGSSPPNAETFQEWYRRAEDERIRREAEFKRMFPEGDAT